MSTAQLTAKKIVTFSSAPSAGANSGGLVIVGSSLFYDNGTLLVPLDLNYPVAMLASEALAAGAWINVWNSSGTTKAQNANATATAKPVHGYVLASVSSGGTANAYLQAGINTAVSGMTAGDVYLSGTAGVGSASPMTGSNGSLNLVQLVGVAINATAVVFQPGGMRLYL